MATISSRLFLLMPVSDDDLDCAMDRLHKLLDAGWYVCGEKMAGRSRLAAGDKIAFYQSRVGVVATATVASSPTKSPPPHVDYLERFPWSFHVTDVCFLPRPVVIDVHLRRRLDAFRDKSIENGWQWFVQATRLLGERDYQIVTGSL